MMRSMPYHRSRLAILFLVTLQASNAQSQPLTGTDRVVLPGFAIDRTEVTITQFSRFA